MAFSKREPKVYAVLPAGGTGERFGQAKQFCLILGQPLLRYTLDSFERINWISKILVVVPADKVKFVQSFAKNDRIEVIIGGNTRHSSIRAALDHLEDQPDFIVVHDGVRPVVEEKVLKELLDLAEKRGASGACRNLISTVLQVTKDLEVVTYPTRSDFVASETPQIFSFPVFQSMYTSISLEDLNCGTECLQLANKYAGVKPGLLHVDEKYFKVTYQSDVWKIERILKDLGYLETK